MSNHKKITLILFLFFSIVSTLYAMRVAPKEVKPVKTDDVIYSAPHLFIMSNSESFQSGGYVMAQDVKTKRIKWIVQVYVTEYDRKLEADVQDVFITDIKLDKEKLIIKDEKHRLFSLDINSLEVQPGN